MILAFVLERFLCFWECKIMVFLEVNLYYDSADESSTAADNIAKLNA